MNEVTKIHLGRQAFTISVDAQHELETYITAVSRQVKDKEVVDEIELRMSELLTERGITTSKVVLRSDVDYLKKQLGNPTDFTDDDQAAETEQLGEPESKRLFRDTDNAMIGGIAAGLAAYFGVDVWLVRLVFIVLAFGTVGWAILIYILLWLLIPEAKTSSDRLRMAGRPVNVKSLKEVVDQADVKGAAHRVNSAVAGPINRIFSLVLKLVGAAFAALGLGGLFGLIAGETYFLARGSAWAKDNIFPVGLREHLLLDISISVAALISVFLILFGIAIYRRKWPIKTWITGVLAGLVFIGLAVGGALAADVYPGVRDRYNANVHTTTYSVKPFTAINTDNSDVNVNLQTSNKYYVALSYYDHPNLSAVKTIVTNGTLVIDTSQLNEDRNCQTLCIPKTYNLSVTIYSPNAADLENQDNNMPPMPPFPPKPFVNAP